MAKIIYAEPVVRSATFRRSDGVKLEELIRYAEGKFLITVTARGRKKSERRDELRLYAILYEEMGTPEEEMAYVSHHHEVPYILNELGVRITGFTLGGGYITVDHRKKRVILAGSSGNYGSCPRSMLEACIRGLKGYSCKILNNEDFAITNSNGGYAYVREWYDNHNIPFEERPY